MKNNVSSREKKICHGQAARTIVLETGKKLGHRSEVGKSYGTGITRLIMQFIFIVAY